MAPITPKADNTNRNYLTYALTPPIVAIASVLILGSHLGDDVGAILGIFFTVFSFTAISTVIVIFLPAIIAAIERRRVIQTVAVDKTEV